MSALKTNKFTFYVHHTYMKGGISQFNVFLEVEHIAHYWNENLALNLNAKYKEIKTKSIKEYDLGKECFVNSPSGILWHIIDFINKIL